MSEFNPLINERLPSDFVFAELFLALGPEFIGGESARLPHVPWLAVLDADTNELQLWQFNEPLNVWARVFVPEHPVVDTVLPVGTRRISLCFDQAERPIVAFELSETVFVTRWDSVAQEYVQNVSFAGVDPVLWFDATVLGKIPDSDVVVFYLRGADGKVYCRVQRDAYGVEYELADVGILILDRIVSGDRRYAVLGTGADGAAGDTMLQSELYPLPPVDVAGGVRLDGGVTGASLYLTVKEYHVARAVSLNGGVTGATLASFVTRIDAARTASLGGGVASARLVGAVVRVDLSAAALLTGWMTNAELIPQGVEQILREGASLGGSVTAAGLVKA